MIYAYRTRHTLGKKIIINQRKWHVNNIGGEWLGTYGEPIIAK